MTDQISTEGWDGVYAIRLSKANEQLQRSYIAGNLPKQMYVQVEGLWFCEINANFDVWQFVPGGGPQLLWLRMPFVEGRIMIGTKSLNLANCGMVVQIRLRYLKLSQMEKQLVLDFQSEDVQGNVVQLIRMDDPHNQLNLLDNEQYFHSAINKYLKENKESISHVLATLQTPSMNEFDWQRPTWEKYAYLNRPTEKDCVIGILMMFQGHEAPRGDPQLAQGVIADNYSAGYLIKLKEFIANTLLIR